MEQKMKEMLERLKEKKSYTQYLFLENELKKEDFPKELKVAFLRNYTVEMLVPVIKGEIAIENVFPNIYIGPYDNIQQDVLETNSLLYQFSPDVICLSISLENLSPRTISAFHSMNKEEIELEKNRIIDWIDSLFFNIRSNSTAVILCNDFIYPGCPSSGIMDLQVDHSQIRVVNQLNQHLYEAAKKYADIYLVGVSNVFFHMGYEHAFDHKAWAVSKNPYSKQALLNVGIEYGKYIKVLLGNIKKCIVLDCDNTLWGGIVGEDGIYGIKLGQDYPGICYQNFQKEILNLYHRGILIALCSKNNEADVLDVLREHKDMLLQEQHIVAYQINWDSKAENIKQIARQLNIGIDSMVFVDDSEFECELVKAQLPEVDVIQLGTDPSKHAWNIRNCGLFNALAFTADDRKRNDNYKAERKREILRGKVNSLEEYLSDLEMKILLRKNCLMDIQRIAQLTQKTNQFNLTAKKYTEAKIKSFMEDDHYDVVVIGVSDKISDLGIVGTAIVHYVKDKAEIDTFLLSCRALGRNLEDVLFKYCLDLIESKKYTVVSAAYYQTKKNQQVSQLFDRYKMKRVSADGGNVLWQDRIPKVAYPEYMQIVTKEQSDDEE